MNLSDRELLARMIQAEAGNQGELGMRAVAAVMDNRRRAQGYGGNTFRDVLLAPGQFSPANSITGYAGGEQGVDLNQLQASQTAYAVADAVMGGNLEDPTGGALNFLNPDISQPSWLSTMGNTVKIGDHLFGTAGSGEGSSGRPGGAAMRLVGGGNSAATGGAGNDTLGETMPIQNQPRGLLGSLGIQKRDEAAGGETAQPFYQRDGFKDTAAILAQGFGRMGIMGMEEIADDIAKQRTENKARNKTAEYLRKAGRTDLADMVDQGLIGGREAAGVLLQKPEDDRTAMMKNYEFYISKGMSPEQAMAALKSGTTIQMPGAPTIGTIPQGYQAIQDPETKAYRLEVIPGGPADTAAKDAAAKDAGLGTKAAAGSTVLGDIAEMKRRVEESPTLTTGLIGGILKNYGGTGALDVDELGKTIRANIGFDRLQRMREESPTGGALGQVAVQELEALQASLGSLNTSQGAPQLIRNLERLEDQYKKSMRRILETEGGSQYFTQGEINMILGTPQGSSGQPTVINGYTIQKVTE